MPPDCRCGEFTALPSSFESLQQRCASAAKIQPTLRHVATNPTTWLSVLECGVCHQRWAKEWPFGELQAGGPACLYQIDAADGDAWLATAKPRFDSLRRQHEDRQILELLGSEIGPEPCKRAGCVRKRIRFGVLCRTHHFESLRGHLPAADLE